MQKGKKIVAIIAAVAVMAALLIADGQNGANACEGDKYNQATGQCVGR